METGGWSDGIVCFMTPRIWVLMLRCVHGSDIVNCIVSLGSSLLLGTDRAD